MINKPKLNCIAMLNENGTYECVTNSSAEVPKVKFEKPDDVELLCISAGAHPWPTFRWFLQARKTFY